MYSYYGKLSTEVYDFTKPVGYSLHGDIEYYLERLKEVEGKILEAGVGSGRFLIPLLENDFEVDGIDYSPSMLASCRKRCEERNLITNLHEGVLSDFSLESRYDAIVIPTGSFGLIEQRDEAKNALQCFYEHLNVGGRVLIDLVFPTDWITGKVSTNAYEISPVEGITLENHSVEIDWINQWTLSYLKYEKWRKGKLVETELQKLVLRWYGVTEFQLLLEEIGFTDVTYSADYTYQKQPSKTSSILTFEGTRSKK